MIENDSVYYTYATNAIEGSSLTQGETLSILQHGITVHGKPLRDHLDVINGQTAFMKMLDMVKTGEPITEETLKDFHQMVSPRDDKGAGIYRNYQNYIEGSRHVPPGEHKVRDRMKEAFWQYEKDVAEGKHPVVAAAKLHYEIVNVHPFGDYNGRTSRLVMNLHLLQNGYVPIAVDLQDRAAYIDALEKSSMSGDALSGNPGRGNPAPFLVYIAGMEQRALSRYVDVLENNLGIPLNPDQKPKSPGSPEGGISGHAGGR
jgi:Fic family protein